MRTLVLMIISVFIFGKSFAQPVAEKVQSSKIDSIELLDYVKKYGQDPKEYMMDKLANYKLVIYGEIHKRKASWDLLKSLLKSPSFSKNTGTVFLEIGRDNQAKMDSFFTKNTIDNELLLSIFRNIQMQGWDDRGMYEFIIDLWNLNKKLTKNSKIKVILVDISRPWSSLKTKEEFANFFKNVPDRNQKMAELIETTMASKNDHRNSLFVVGFGHAFKTKITFGERSYVSAGAYLKEHLTEKSVFITCPHSGIMGNTGKQKGMTRGGLFDYSFAKNGDKPLAFNLAKSPFGKEHFDLMIELPSESVKTFEDYFDGYIFFMPLADEGPYYVLPELFTEQFLQELRRRASVCGYDEWQEYGVKIKEITMNDIQKYLQETSKNRYWKNILSE